MGCASSVESTQAVDDKEQSEETQPSQSATATESATKHVTKREARDAFNALASTSVAFKPIKLIKVGQALKDSVGSSSWKPFNLTPTAADIERAAKVVVRFRDESGIVRSDGGFLQEAFGVQAAIVEQAHRDVRNLKLNSAEPALDTALSVHATIAQAMGLHVSELSAWMGRFTEAVDCLVTAALSGCELHGDPRLPHRPVSSTLAAAVNATALRMFAAHAAAWDAVLEAHATNADDIATVFETALTPIIQRLPPKHFHAAAFLRSAVRTATSLLVFAHGGRRMVPSFGAFTSKSPLSRLHLRSLSCVVEKFWSYCAHPNGGMELTRKVDDEAMALLSFCAFIGAIPTAAGNLDSVGVAASHLLGPAISPSATSVVLYFVAILTTQFRLDIKNISRPTILQQASEALQAVVFRAAQTAAPVSSKVFPTFVDEAGEGHGPRKEFFDLVAQALCSPHAPPLRLRGAALVDGVGGGSMLRIRPAISGSFDAMVGLIVAGNVLELTVNGAVFRAAIHSVRKDPDAIGVRIASPLPDDCDGVPLDAVSKVQPQCFAPVSFDSQYVWFNEGVADDDKLQRHYYLAGWSLGAAVANGVGTPLRLPPVFVKLARQRITGMAYAVNERDLIDMDLSYVDSIALVRAMKPDDFRNYIKTLDDDGADAASDVAQYLTFTDATFNEKKEQYITAGMVEDTIFRRCRKRLDATIDGFRASLIPVLPAAWATSSERLHAAICGDADNVNNDFRFADHFNIVLAPDFTETPHGKLFGDLIVKALDGAHFPPGEARIRYKRALLKFITGRDLLPAHPKTESIHVECGSICETTIEHAYGIGRLPAAHTCTNAVQIPNYLENLAFGADDVACRTTVGHSWSEKMCIVTKDILHRGWGRLLPQAQTKLVAEAQELLTTKLTVAVLGADSYELDEHDFSRQSDEEDDDEDARRRSSVMRGIPPPRRRNTGDKLEEMAKRTASLSTTGGGIAPSVVSQRPAVVDDDNDYEDPFEDGAGAGHNPFAPPDDDSPPPDDGRRGTAVPVLLPGHQHHHQQHHHTSAASRLPAQSSVAPLPQQRDFDDDDDDDDYDDVEPAQAAMPVLSDFGEPKRATVHSFDD